MVRVSVKHGTILFDLARICGAPPISLSRTLLALPVISVVLIVFYVSMIISGLNWTSKWGRIITSRVNVFDSGTSMIVVRIMSGRNGRLPTALGRNLTGLERYVDRRWLVSSGHLFVAFYMWIAIALFSRQGIECPLLRSNGVINLLCRAISRLIPNRFRNLWTRLMWRVRIAMDVLIRVRVLSWIRFSRLTLISSPSVARVSVPLKYDFRIFRLVRSMVGRRVLGGFGRLI